jgi:hypothetical protein
LASFSLRFTIHVFGSTLLPNKKEEKKKAKKKEKEKETIHRGCYPIKFIILLYPAFGILCFSVLIAVPRLSLEPGRLWSGAVAITSF